MNSIKLQKSQRLESLDVLRGFDLFLIVALEPIIPSLNKAIDKPWFNKFLWNFRHVPWEGFSPWDLVMPLFLFMAGVSIPFAMSRYRTSSNKRNIYYRIIKRVILLWIFGMMCQGNLLALDPNHIYLYSNTLQAIAMGYLIASLLFLHTGIRTQIIAAIGLLAIYWVGMEFISVGDFGGGNYSADYNMAEWIDRQVLGRFRHYAEIVNGEVLFHNSYRYTWILSSLNFGVTTLTGVFAGHILKSKTKKSEDKWKLLLLIGLIMTATGWLLHLQMPVIKKIWTSSMVLVSSGYSFILMALFYYRIDHKQHRKGITWLKFYGMNSIFAYMLVNIISFKSLAHSLFFGFEQYIGKWYPVLIVFTNSLVIFFILWFMFKNKIFLKV